MPLIAFLIAVAGPLLLNEAVLPNTSHPNQIFAVFGWGLVLFAAPAQRAGVDVLRALRPLLLALALVCVGCVLSMATGGVPTSPGWAMLAMQLMAAALALHGASIACVRPEAVFRAFAIALVVAGVLGALIGILQIFTHVELGNPVIAALVDAGRAVGNLGQPNQFADTQVWALAALVPLLPSVSAQDLRARMLRVGLLAIGVLLLFGVILSASRTGMVGIAMLAAWGIFDRSLPRQTRIALVASVAVAALLWWGMSLWAQGDVKAADLGHRPGDFSTVRFLLWKHSMMLIAQQPLLGVGWGQYAFATALTPMSDRVPRFDDHAHNLPLQLAVELGVPMALAIVALLVAALWLAIRNVRRLPGHAGIAGRSVVLMILYMGVHSMVEYPLWYTYFLFPTAWLWGLALGWSVTPVTVQATSVAADAQPRQFASMPPDRAWRVGGALMAVSGAVAWLSYLTIVDAYQPNYRGPTPMAERIGRAEASPLFRNYADRMVALQAESPAEVLPYIQRAVRANPNGAVMFAWINGLELSGKDDEARYVAARLREFKLTGPAPFYAPCDDPAVTEKPFQCLPPKRAMTWRDFK